MAFTEQLLLPTTQIISLQKDKLDQSFISISQVFNRHAMAINLRTIGIYSPIETLDGEVFYANLPDDGSAVYRTFVNFGALPNAGTKSVSTGIIPTGTYRMTRLYATAEITDSMNVNFLKCIPIPYASVTAVANNIEINVTVGGGGVWFINISTAIDYSDYDSCYAVIEYTKL